MHTLIATACERTFIFMSTTKWKPSSQRFYLSPFPTSSTLEASVIFVFHLSSLCFACDYCSRAISDTSLKNHFNATLSSRLKILWLLIPCPVDHMCCNWEWSGGSGCCCCCCCCCSFSCYCYCCCLCCHHCCCCCCCCFSFCCCCCRCSSLSHTMFMLLLLKVLNSSKVEIAPPPPPPACASKTNVLVYERNENQ